MRSVPTMSANRCRQAKQRVDLWQGLTRLLSSVTNQGVAANRVSTSVRVGKDAWVPGRVTHSAAARLARRTASSSGTLSTRKTARLPMNASPAPEASTACSGTPGTYFTVCPSTTSTPRPQRHQHRAWSSILERSRCRLRLVRRCDAMPCQQFRLGFVGDAKVRQLEQFVGQRHGGSGIEDRPHAGGPRRAERLQGRFQRHLQLTEQHAGFADFRGRRARPPVTNRDSLPARGECSSVPRHRPRSTRPRSASPCCAGRAWC